jgi:hypothetical protein
VGADGGRASSVRTAFGHFRAIKNPGEDRGFSKFRRKVYTSYLAFSLLRRISPAPNPPIATVQELEKR